MIKYPYFPYKASQAVHYILCNVGDGTDTSLIMALLYLADREALLVHGKPITGDLMYSTAEGPILSLSYDLAEGTPLDEYPEALSVWHSYIKQEQNNKLFIAKPLPRYKAKIEALYGDLSLDDIEFLDDVIRKYGNLSFLDIHNLMYALPEYDKDVRKMPKRIDPAMILRNGNWSEQNISSVVEDAKESLVFHRTFNIK